MKDMGELNKPEVGEFIKLRVPIDVPRLSPLTHLGVKQVYIASVNSEWLHNLRTLCYA